MKRINTGDFRPQSLWANTVALLVALTIRHIVNKLSRT